MNLLGAIHRYVDRYMVLRDYSPETSRAYRGDLQQFFVFLTTKYKRVVEVNEITERDIEDFLFDQQRKLTAKSVTRRGSTVRSFFKWARRERLVETNLGADVPLPKTRRPLPYCPSKELVQDFLNSCTDPLVWAFTSTMYYTGLRISEVCGLKLADVDVERGVLTVHNGKGGKDRQVPLNLKVQTVLGKYLSDIRPSGRYPSFFATSRGTLSERWASERLRKERRRQGKSEQLTAHSFRHAFATHLYQSGCDLRKLKDLMGHSSLHTLDLYIRLGHNDLQEAVNLL